MHVVARGFEFYLHFTLGSSEHQACFLFHSVFTWCQVETMQYSNILKQQHISAADRGKMFEFIICFAKYCENP